MSIRLTNALKRTTISMASQITKLAKSFAPEHIAPHIRSKVETKSEGVFIIRTTVDRSANSLQKYGTADARAQEYGSGERATRGPKGKIIIHPKTAQFLEFPGTNQYEGWLIRTQEVKSPGIHPVKASPLSPGYIRPAIKTVRQRAKQELTPEVRKAIIGDLRQSFGRKPK